MSAEILENIMCAKKDYIWNPSTCTSENIYKHLENIWKVLLMIQYLPFDGIIDVVWSEPSRLYQ